MFKTNSVQDWGNKVKQREPEARSLDTASNYFEFHAQKDITTLHYYTGQVHRKLCLGILQGGYSKLQFSSIF